VAVAAVAGAVAAAWEEAGAAADAASVEASQPVLEDIAFAPTAVKKCPINWGLPAMSRNARNAEPQ
jgi:hypothetical protein